MTLIDDQHVAWMARSFGRADYLPLGPKDLEVLASVAEPITRFVGSHLFRQDDAAVAAYLIREGEVDLYRHRSGRRHVVARAGPGAVLGDIAMFGGGIYLAGAQAVTHVRALRFERDTLLPELGRHPALCLRWLVAGQRQLEIAHRRIVQLMHGTVLARVAALLLDESPRPGRVRLSQEEMAMLLGTTRQSVNEALATLRRRGAVATSYRTIDVLDPETLRVATRGEAA